MDPINRLSWFLDKHSYLVIGILLVIAVVSNYLYWKAGLPWWLH